MSRANVVPWNKGLTAFDRGWAAGFSAGQADRFWHRLRTLAPVALVLGWLYLAIGRRTPPMLRLVATFGFLFAVWLALVLLPVLLVALVVREYRRRQRRPRRPEPVEPWPDDYGEVDR